LAGAVGAAAREGLESGPKVVLTAQSSRFSVTFEKHGDEVKAKDVAQYLRKAEDFARNLRGASRSNAPGPTPNVMRYSKMGKFVDLDPGGNIISFGAK
jgi:hypothetical protein